MFYCKECGEKNGYVEGFLKSFGKCELCGKTAECSDVPSKYLKKPEPKNGEVGKCCLCGGDYDHWGNNASPIKDGRCCDKCNEEVIKARMAKIKEALTPKEKAKAKLFKAIYGAMLDVDNQCLTGAEIVDTAVKTVAHFAKEEGLE